MQRFGLARRAGEVVGGLRALVGLCPSPEQGFLSPPRALGCVCVGGTCLHLWGRNRFSKGCGPRQGRNLSQLPGWDLAWSWEACGHVHTGALPLMVE